MKKMISLLLAMTMMIPMGMTVFADETITINVDGTPAVFPDAQPFIDESGRTLVPIAPLAEMLDCDSRWDEGNNTVYISKKIHKDSAAIKIVIGDSVIVHGKKIYGDWDMQPVAGFSPKEEIQMDTAALIKDDRTYIPLRFAAIALGYSVEWNSETTTIDLKNNLDNEPFEFGLLSKMPKDTNYMVSPFSLKMAFAMAANGANGDA